MITYQKLGSYGRLGNQMFQYAAMLGISEKTGHEFGYAPGRLLDCFDIRLGKPLTGPEPVKYLYAERSFDFNPDVFSCPDSVDFVGYYQSEKYWSHCRERVVEQFKFRNSILSPAGEFTSLHIRRGDYVHLKDTHTCLADTDYYDRSINALDPNKLIIFTDDRSWLNDSGMLSKWSRDRQVEVCSLESDFDELDLMSRATNAIVANSSFSWWGAYLGPQQRGGRVIAPEKWFGPQGPGSWRDVYCEGWEII